MAQVELSVIIPVLNEQESLPILLRQLQQQQGVMLEIIVADGGSKDRSQYIAQQAGATWVNSAPGRGVQMNQGATHSQAPWLLFLHADSGLSHKELISTALTTLRQTQQKSPHVAGHFPLKFTGANPAILKKLWYNQAKTYLNRHQVINGDQGMMLHRDFFEQLGGFDTTLPFLEDQRLAAAVHQRGRWITLPGLLESSARRFEQEGAWQRRLLNIMIMTAYSLPLTAFFKQAGTLYRQQAKTGQLHLSPFFKSMKELGTVRYNEAPTTPWGRGGHYLQQNLWQFAFMLDQKQDQAPLHTPWLDRYDRFMAPILEHATLRPLWTGMIWILFHLMWLYCWFQERYNG
ncbi:TIGR04283 family arsenosugar biosynthesis glycosyltransferase [Magnetococcus sp. PR-3]|uniref:TIGR04283 family arsenosugar biosynthesis glycosyltransferase n=1 Tax=Magnetococcus sp. PR-3 TaxID=3120355 RepID=UPI002FCE5169